MIHSYRKFVRVDHKDDCDDKEFKEDFKTFATIGQLRYLPSDLFWHLLRASSVFPKSLPETAGKLEAFEMWPSWDSKDTSNSIRVEPDVFIRFTHFDLIIEVKIKDSKGQTSDQWKKEITAYHNTYGTDTHRDFFLLALGGNSNLDRDTEHDYVHKATWTNLLHAVHDCRKQRSYLCCKAESTEQEIRILEAVEEAFAQYNEYVVDLLATLPKYDMNIETPLNINKIWKEM